MFEKVLDRSVALFAALVAGAARRGRRFVPAATGLVLLGPSAGGEAARASGVAKGMPKRVV